MNLESPNPQLPPDSPGGGPVPAASPVSTKTVIAVIVAVLFMALCHWGAQKIRETAEAERAKKAVEEQAASLKAEKKNAGKKDPVADVKNPATAENSQPSGTPQLATAEKSGSAGSSDDNRGPTDSPAPSPVETVPSGEKTAVPKPVTQPLEKPKETPSANTPRGPPSSTNASNSAANSKPGTSTASPPKSTATANTTPNTSAVPKSVPAPNSKPADEKPKDKDDADKKPSYVMKNVTIRDFGRVVFKGDVDLTPTIERIEKGDRNAHRNDGTVFGNRERKLPNKPQGYYHEYVHPTPGINGPGPQRVVIGEKGEIYYTADHYESFRRVNP